MRNNEILTHFIYDNFTGVIIDKFLVPFKKGFLFAGEYGIYFTDTKSKYGTCNKLSLLQIKNTNLTNVRFSVASIHTSSIFNSKTYTMELHCEELGWVKLFEVSDRERAVGICNYLNNK